MKIDLGNKEGNISLPGKGGSRKWYPCVTLRGEDGGLMDLPDEGMAKVRFRVKSRTERRPGDEDEDYGGYDSPYAVEIELLDLEAEEGSGRTRQMGSGDKMRMVIEAALRGKKTGGRGADDETEDDD